MGGYPTVQISEPTMWHTILFDFWLVILFVFSLGGHTNSYREAVYEHGAFELCLPSLGFLFTKLTLRSQLLGQACHMAKVWVGSGHKQSATLCRSRLRSIFYIGC